MEAGPAAIPPDEEPRSLPMPSMLRLACLIGVSLAALGLHPARGDDAPRRPDIYLVTIDTLRADATQPYQADRRTPHLQALVPASQVFEQAVAPMPLTRPSHFSMFTGLYPREHGVRNNTTDLPQDTPVLAEALAAAGYRTAGFVSVRHLSRGSGAERGFSTYADTRRVLYTKADLTVSRAARFIAEAPADEPVFVWIHTFDPHQPYEPPAAFQHDLDVELLGRYPRVKDEQLEEIARAHQGSIPKRFLEYVTSLYHREAEYNDHRLGALLTWIGRERGLTDALVIVTSDHGECFEKGIYFGHARCLYEGAIRVPLLIKWPGNRVVGRSSQLVGLVDLAPSILREAGLSPDWQTSGRAIQDLDDPERTLLIEHPDSNPRTPPIRDVAGDPVAPPVGDRAQVGLVGPKWKYIRTGTSRHELYPMGPNPDERTNQAEDRPEERARWATALDAMLAAHPARNVEVAPVDPALRRSLEALGYVEESSPPAGDTGSGAGGEPPPSDATPEAAGGP